MRRGCGPLIEGHPMWRWIRNVLIVFSMVIFVAGSVFWVRSFWRFDALKIEHGHDVENLGIGSVDQRLFLGWYWDNQRIDRLRKEPDWTWETFSIEHRGEEDQFAQLRSEAPSIGALGIEMFWTSEPTPGKVYRAFLIPYWFIVPLAAFPPSWWMIRGRQQGKAYRRKRGLCLICGYDLRQTSGTCPECGNKVFA